MSWDYEDCECAERYAGPEHCVECGADEGEICASVGGEPYCGPCFREREREKKAKREADARAKEAAVTNDGNWSALDPGLLRGVVPAGVKEGCE